MPSVTYIWSVFEDFEMVLDYLHLTEKENLKMNLYSFRRHTQILIEDPQMVSLSSLETSDFISVLGWEMSQADLDVISLG